MVKIQAGRADSFAKAPDAKSKAILVYGPDSGLVYERSQLLIHSVLKGDNDPFRLAEIDSTTLKADPARLADEVAALSLTGGRRVVKVRDASDAISQPFERLFDDFVGDALVVCIAGDLGPRSSLRKIFEAAENAAALPCYSDDARSLDQIVREDLKSAGFTADSDALAWLLDHLGSDRALSRQELEKLLLFKSEDPAKKITLNDVIACIGDTAAFDLDDLIYAMADGDQPSVQRVYGRMMAEGTSPISVLTAASRHLLRLHQVHGYRASGSIDNAMMKLRPPVFFKRKGQFKAQAGRWSPKLLARGLEVLTTAELQAKSTDMPSQALIERALMQIAAAAKSTRR